MKILMLMLLLLSINFMFVKYPLSMGFILLMQTIFASLTHSLNLNSYFTSYILFLIFIGGMLILFMYIKNCNEKLLFPMKLLLLNISLIMFLSMINIIDFNNQNMVMLISLYNGHCNYSMNKLYSLLSSNIKLFMVMYLLFTLVIVSNIIKLKNSPLRSN